VNAADGQKTGPSDQTRRASRYGQIGTASLVSLAHGTNDAQKTMGVITLALVVHGTLEDASAVPFWVKLVAAASIALGTYIGGWRIIRTLGQRVFAMEPAAGFAAQTSAGMVLYGATAAGFPVSTTQCISGAVMGSGATQRFSAVRWGVAGNIVLAWIVTIPAAALVGGLLYWPIEALF
jgi:PiT family inorganic phosphate transporter